MNTPTLSNVDAYNAEILSNAIRFDACLFLGRGEYANASETSHEDILVAADILKAENPKAKGDVMIYAFDEAGNKTLISGAPYKSGKDRQKGTLSLKLEPIGDDTPETVTSAGREDEIIDMGPIFGKGISHVIAAAALEAETAAAIAGIDARLDAGEIFVSAPDMAGIMLNDEAGDIAIEHRLAKLASDAKAAAKPAKGGKAKLPALESALNTMLKPAKPAKAPKAPKEPKAPKAEKPAAEPKAPKGPSKWDIAREMLLRADGVQKEELFAALKWRSMSIPLLMGNTKLSAIEKIEGGWKGAA